MAQKPPAWARFDQAGQVPLMLSRDVDEAGVQDPVLSANVLADQLIRRQQAAINRFVAVQRQAVELGNKDVHSAVLPLDGVDVYYIQVQGLERMHYHVNPEALGREEPVSVPAVARGAPDWLTTPQFSGGLAVQFFDGAT